MHHPALIHEKHQPRGPALLTPAQARKVGGGVGTKIYIWEYGQPLRTELIFYPYPPTFPVKTIGTPIAY